jgi:arginyl-tRNA synthetase
LAQAFSRFCAASPILTGPPAARGSRLALAKAMLAQLELLGIDAPERM